MAAFTRIVLALSVCLTATAQAQARRIELNDLGREIGLSSPRLSPDGRQVALVVTRTNYADNRFERSIALVDVATGAVREITPGRRSVGSPEWSPRGDRLAFTDQENDRPAQLYVLPVAGGEARKLTDLKRGVSGFAWRPDGAMLAVLSQDDPVELTGDEKHNKSFEVGDNMYLETSASLPTHLWTVADTGGSATRVTSGTRSVTGVAWTPDGKSVVLSVRPRPHSGELINSTFVVRDMTGGTERTLTERRSFGGTAMVSPDGKLVATTATRGAELGFHPATVVVTPIDGGESRDATPSIDRNIGNVRWLPDGRGLIVTAADFTRYRAWVQPLGGGAPRKLDWGNVDAGDVFVGATGALAFVGREPNRPPELYVAASVDAAPKRLTDYNKELAAVSTGKVETIEWDGPNGFRQNGTLTYPPNYVAGQKYPLVLYIHGGPMGTSAEGWQIVNHLFAAQGWIVFSPNYRGSDNMGDKFQSAVVNDAGEGPGRDVMSGIAVLKKRGLIDDTRMAVSGWSYGGYMTAWLTAQYQGWKAAVAGAAVTDWFDWYNLADMNTWAGFGLGGSPWKNDNAMNYWKQSPMAYAHKIKTPTLILSTTGDPRVTVTQSYKYYHALKDNGTEVKFIAYPTGGHFPPDPVHQRDVRRRWIAWIAEKFGPTS